MRKLIIGRHNTSDIVIPDTSDMVSRKHAVLTVSFWGKMVIYDTSNNGTFINGVKLDKGKGRKVTRNDRINFSGEHDLDWNEVKDPYRLPKIVGALFCVTVILVIVFLTMFVSLPIEESHQ